MKFLIWFIIILVGLTATRLFNARQARRTAPQPAKTDSGAEHMVRCARCGIYLPRSEALLIGKRTWCCEDHARLGPNLNQQP